MDHEKEEEYQEAIWKLARALELSLMGFPVRNAPHCFAAAENLTQGTKYEYRQGQMG